MSPNVFTQAVESAVNIHISPLTVLLVVVAVVCLLLISGGISAARGNHGR